MTTKITVETLSPITHNQIPVITTESLSILYGTDPVRIRQNHHENKIRFVEGKHYFKVTGDELKDLRVALNYSQNPISPKTRFLILWTERGAARHAKMLETDQAWEVFEKLEDHYFNQKENQQVDTVKPSGRDYRYRVRVIIYDELFGGCVEMLGKAETFRDIASGISTDLGYKPNAFTHVPACKEKMKRIY
jgi:hypothetical protein